MPQLNVTVSSLADAPFSIGALITGFEPDGTAYAPTGVVVNSDQDVHFPTDCQSALLQHPTASNAGIAYLGGSDVDSTNYAYAIIRGDRDNPFDTGCNSIHLDELWLTFDSLNASTAVFAIAYNVL